VSLRNYRAVKAKGFSVQQPGYCPSWTLTPDVTMMCSVMRWF
jgi:hypothetical protein